MSFVLIPDQLPERALRLRRQLMAVYSYLLIALSFLVGIQLKLIPADMPVGTIFGVLLAFNAIVFMAVRSGWTELLRDPSMTFLQVLAGEVLVTVLLHYCGDLRGIVMSLYFLVMTFGIFALSRGSMVLIAIAVVVCYCLLLLFESAVLGQSRDAGLAFAEISVLSLGLAWFVYVGGHIHNLQMRIRDQRESLATAHSSLEHTNQQLQETMARLERIAIRDELTGLYNRRHLLERLDEFLSHAERTHSPLHLALIDLDHFKLVNDRYGHAAGDMVLKHFADLARQKLRRSDFISRYGGEEFIVVFPEGKLEDVHDALDRLRFAFATHCFDKIESGLSVTLSAGITPRFEGDTCERIIQRADEALYRAKAEGRNRIVQQTFPT